MSAKTSASSGYAYYEEDRWIVGVTWFFKGLLISNRTEEFFTQSQTIWNQNGNLKEAPKKFSSEMGFVLAICLLIAHWINSNCMISRHLKSIGQSCRSSIFFSIGTVCISTSLINTHWIIQTVWLTDICKINLANHVRTLKIFFQSGWLCYVDLSV